MLQPPNVRLPRAHVEIEVVLAVAARRAGCVGGAAAFADGTDKVINSAATVEKWIRRAFIMLRFRCESGQSK
jgi:hypothetical protein